MRDEGALPEPELVLRRGDLGVEGEVDRRTPARGGDERSDDRPGPGPSPSAPGVNGEGDPDAGDHRRQRGRAEERCHRGDRHDGELPATRRTPGQLPRGQHGAREQDVELVLLHSGGVLDAQRRCRDRRRDEEPGQAAETETADQRVHGGDRGDAGHERRHLGPGRAPGGEHEHRAIEKVGAGCREPHAPGLPDADVGGQCHPGVVAPQPEAAQAVGPQTRAKRRDDGQRDQGEPTPSSSGGSGRPAPTARRGRGYPCRRSTLGERRRRVEHGRVGTARHPRCPRRTEAGPRPRGRDTTSPTLFSRQVAACA